MTNTLSEKEIKAIEKLEVIGISRTEGRTLFHMFNQGESIAVDIERATNLRQPEVSIATKKLTERGWIKSTPIKRNTGKGRPIHRYSFAKRKRDILSSINRMFSEKIKALEKERETFNALMEAGKKEQ
ncbi:unnamed protein product [marine sediment metagenome]|uniref:Transcription regulator TrmB N-terminal domain-containing protein n=1 Tax=marine sediment metagenome TaxID=412755 RepID=X1B2D0_9ZZZZ